MNSIAQIEYADTFVEALPTNDTLNRMERLLVERHCALKRLERRELVLRALDRPHNWFVSPGERDRITNEVNHAARQVAENKREIVEVARQIVAEANNQELLQVRDCINCEQREAEAKADAEMRTI